MMRIFAIIAVGAMICSCAVAEMRTWTSKSGKTIEGGLSSVLFDNVVITNAAGMEIKIPKNELSQQDQEYVALVNPPKLKVDLLKSNSRHFIKESPFQADFNPPSVLVYTFGARITSVNRKEYPYPLTVEIYPIASQTLDTDKYCKMGKLESKPFVLSKENGCKFEFDSPRSFEMITYVMGQEERGRKFSESLILVRDKRGEVIAYNTTKDGLMDNIDKFIKLPDGAWFDDKCERVHPTQPKPNIVN